MRLLLIASIIAIVSFQSCKKVSSDDLKDTVPYYQSYTVRYDVDKDETKAEAKFRVRSSSGTAVQLEGSAKVMANGLTPTTPALEPTNYKWEFSGLKDISFALTKSSGQSFANNFDLASIGSFYFNSNFPTSIPSNTGLSFRWEGDAIPSGVSCTVDLLGTDVNDELKTLSKAVSSNQITFSSSEMQGFKPGKSVTVKITRNNTWAPQNDDAGAGGIIRVSIESQKNLMIN